MTGFKIYSFLIFTNVIIFISSEIQNVSQASFNCQKRRKSNLHVTNYYASSFDNLAYIRFETLKELNISCGFLVEHGIYMLGMMPTNKHFLLDQYFDIRPLLNSLIFFDDIINIEMHNINGFNLNPNSKYTSLSVENNITIFTFVDSHFDFYLNGTRLITEELCVRGNFENTILNLGKILIFTSTTQQYVLLNSCVSICVQPESI